MKSSNSSLLSLLLLVTLSVSSRGLAQEKRPPAKPTRRVVPTSAAPAPTFETLLGTDSYKIYVEVRNVGQLIRSSAVNDLLDPVLKLAAPPKEFRTFVKWLNNHADEVMTSRMLVATWPTAKNVPDAVIAIEFGSPDEAAKFEPQLNSLLPKVLPTPTPAASPKPEDNQSDDATITKPSYYLVRAGSLILITPTKLVLKNLRPNNSKLLTEDANFRIARTRFSSDQVFLFLDVRGIEKEEEEQRRQIEEERKKRVAEEAIIANSKPVPANNGEEPEQPKVETYTDVTPPTAQQPAEQTETDRIAGEIGALANLFFQGQSKWPETVGFGFSFDSDSFYVRALLLTAPGQKCDAIPYFPNLILGTPLAVESASILPADTELSVVFSLDLPQILTAMSITQITEGQQAETQMVKDSDAMDPLAEIEKRLNVNLKKELVPLLGNEVVVSMPVNMFDGPVPRPTPNASPIEPGDSQNQKPVPSIVIALSLKDKDGMRSLLPKLVDSMGFKGASGLAQTERRENTELVSYGDMFAYAFVEDFLIVSPDVSATRHVVDAYLKHETLSNNIEYKNATRWQPRALQAQLYLSPALMESYKTWIAQPNNLMSDQTREILSRLSMLAEPVTYALSTDGLGTLHELHVPKNLLLMAVTGISAESNPSPMIVNERAAMSILHQIADAEIQYSSGKGAGTFCLLEQLQSEGLLSDDLLKNHGYRIDLTVVGDNFQVTAIPDEYGKTGKISYFIDHSNVLRGADRGGGIATVADDPIN